MEPSAKVENLKKVEPNQTMQRVLLMAIGDDGQPTPFRVSGENNGEIGGGGGGGGTITEVVAGEGLSGGGTTGAVTLDVNVDNSSIEISADALRIKADGVTNAMQADMAALSVKANATNAPANPTDVAAASDGQVFRRSGTALAFGAVDLASANAVTNTLPVGNGGLNTSTAPSSAQIPVASGATAYVPRTVSGIASLSNTGVLSFSSTGLEQVTRKNLVINGNFSLNQRGQTGNLATDNTYGLDRWRGLSEASPSMTMARTADSGQMWKYRCDAGVSFTANNSKYGIFQPIEGIDIYQTRGKTVCLSASLLVTGSTLNDVRMGILQWTSTENAVSGDPINSWGTTGNPTLTTWTYLNTPANLSVTGSYVQYSVTGTVSSSATNLGVFIWNNDQATTFGDVLQIANVQLEVGSAPTPFENRPIQQELALCQRYCWTQETAVSGFMAQGFAISTTQAIVFAKTPVTMRIAPSLASSVTATDWQVSDGVTNTDLTNIAMSAATTDFIRIVATVGAGLTQYRPMTLNGDSAATRLLTVEAEL